MNKFYKAALTVLLCATSVSSMDSPTITNPAVTANQYFQETTCFFDAIQDGNIDLVKQLLEENRDLVLRKVNGMSAIHLAIFCGQTDMAKVLYDECPESIYFQNAQGEFVITSALDLLNTYQNKKDYEFVSYVLDNPHNVLQDFMVNMMREQISKIGIEIEKKNKDSSIQDLWQQKETSFFGAIKDGNIFLIKKFLEDDKERVSRKAADMLPLYYAIGCHQIEVAKYLSDIYPESILLEGSANKKNALTRAAENGSYDFITYVFENHRKILTDVALDDFFLKYGNYEVIKSIINNKLTTVNMKDSFLKK